LEISGAGTCGHFRAQVRKAASGPELPNDTVLLVTGCFQCRPTGAPDPLLPFVCHESGLSKNVKLFEELELLLGGQLPLVANDL
jgi:hypothetical protein